MSLVKTLNLMKIQCWVFCFLLCLCVMPCEDQCVQSKSGRAVLLGQLKYCLDNSQEFNFIIHCFQEAKKNNPTYTCRFLISLIWADTLLQLNHSMTRNYGLRKKWNYNLRREIQKSMRQGLRTMTDFKTTRSFLSNADAVSFNFYTHFEAIDC